MSEELTAEEVWEKVKGFFKRTIGRIIVLLLIGFFLLLMFRATFVTSVDNYELGFVFDRVTGKITRIDRQGWVVYTPFVYSVHTIDLRPYQLTISANERVLNAKLVKFDPNGLDTFVAWHGRGAGDSLTNLKEILKCYAFDVAGGKDCPFLIVLQDIAPNQGGGQPISSVAGKGASQ